MTTTSRAHAFTGSRTRIHTPPRRLEMHASATLSRARLPVGVFSRCVCFFEAMCLSLSREKNCLTRLSLDPSGWVASLQRRFILFSLPLSLPRSPNRDHRDHHHRRGRVAILDSSSFLDVDRFGSTLGVQFTASRGG